MKIILLLKLSSAVILSILCCGDFINNFPNKTVYKVGIAASSDDPQIPLEAGIRTNRASDLDPKPAHRIVSDIPDVSPNVSINKSERKGASELDLQPAHRIALDVPDLSPNVSSNKSKREDLQPAHRIALAEDVPDLSPNVSTNKSDREVALEGFKRLWPVQRWSQWGYFTEDYLEVVNVHWLRFPPPPPLQQEALGAVYILFSTVGCGGNAIVVFMYLRSVGL
ncbi:unnamed protein product [Plutella xylostella]|uniref:(diamondback moth) hypothetical protein n=1 Tax=Plutella xylostella TaxID=51655 RepID=A0A8S4FWS1_PLUXY|nr:unnamed protein product [Plutella xylostella]